MKWSIIGGIAVAAAMSITPASASDCMVPVTSTEAAATCTLTAGGGTGQCVMYAAAAITVTWIETIQDEQGREVDIVRTVYSTTGREILGVMGPTGSSSFGDESSTNPGDNIPAGETVTVTVQAQGWRSGISGYVRCRA